MENFFLLLLPKDDATRGQRLFCGIVTMILVYIQLIPLAAVVGYGFRLGFGG